MSNNKSTGKFSWKTDSYQNYILHLIDGKSCETYEPYDLPMNKGLIASYRSLKDNDMIEVLSGILDERVYIPKKSIVAISTGGVTEREYYSAKPLPDYRFHKTKEEGEKS